MGVNWTKSWSSSDNGSVLSGADLANIQNDIDGAVPTKTGAEVISGNWEFTGDLKFSGTDDIYDVTEAICMDNDVVCHNNEIVYM